MQESVPAAVMVPIEKIPIRPLPKISVPSTLPETLSSAGPLLASSGTQKIDDDVSLPPDALRVYKPVISVSGLVFSLPSQTAEVYLQSISLAASFHRLFQSLSSPLLISEDLAAHFKSVQHVFAPDAFENAALAFANKFDWSDEMLARYRDLLRAFGSIDSVLEHHSAIHRAAGMNPERINRWLFNDDPRLPLLLTMAQTGGEVDTDPEFVPFRHSGPL
jgi:hypothetical protein